MNKSILSLSKDFGNWFNSLDEMQQSRFIYLVKYSFFCSEKVRKHHIDRIKFGFFIIGSSKYKTIGEYISEEMYHNYRELSKTSLDISWRFLSVITESVVESMLNSYKDMATDSSHHYLLEQEHEYTLLFWSVFISSANIDYYLSHPIDFKIKHEENRIDIPELWDIIDFLGMYLFSIQLYDISIKIKDKDTIKSIGNLFERPKRVLIPPIFEGLFYVKKNAQEVKDILETKGFTENGHWHGLTGAKSELLGAYYELKPLLFPGSKTSQVKIFCLEFGLSEQFMSDRMMRNEPFNANRDEFQRIFSHLIKKEKK